MNARFEKQVANDILYSLYSFELHNVKEIKQIAGRTMKIDGM